MRLLLLKDLRTEVEYNEIIGHKRKAKKGDVIVRTLKLHDTEEIFRKQTVRLKVKVVTNKSIHVEVF